MKGKEKSKDKKIQYTKKIITFLLVVSSMWITWSYGMATYSLIVLGITEPLAELSIQVCITIIGTVVVYCLKSYFETKAEKDNELLALASTEAIDDDMMGG